MFIYPRVGGRGRTSFRGRADSAGAAAFSTIFGGKTAVPGTRVLNIDRILKCIG